MNVMKQVDVVVFILQKNGKILAEKRRTDDDTDAGKIALPGGHVEPGEKFEDACRREMREELEVDGTGFKFIIKLLHHTEIEDQMISYYFCGRWKGTPKSIEAESLLWIDAKDTSTLDLEVDKKALKEFFSKFMKK